MSAADVVEVRTTLPDRDTAEHLAAGAVDSRLAACAQVSGPVSSWYRWKGAVEQATEWQCAFKTVRDRWPELERFIRNHHPYDLPEIVMLPLAGSDPYLGWIVDEVAG